MAKTADTIAIYSRKSRYTGKGESIGNQIDLPRIYPHSLRRCRSTAGCRL